MLLRQAYPMEPLQDGTMLRDRYKIERRVETNAGENMYRVRDQKFSTDWAMREYDASRVTGEARATAQAAFDAEAQKLEQLRHQGMAQVVDHFVEGDRAYVVGEWVDGRSWQALLDSKGGRLPLDAVADLGAKLLDVFYFFHTGYDPISFRVLNPRAVWVTDDDEIKLVDYGLGTHFDPRRQAPGYVFGTPGFISPEHRNGAPPDLLLDIYAAGALLWLSATGRDPATFGDAPLPTARSLQPDVPEALDRVIMKAVHPDPKQRHFDVGEFKHDLMAVAEGFAPDSSPSAGAVASTEAPTVAAGGKSGPGKIVGSKRSGGCAPVILFVLAALAFLIRML